MAEYIERGRLLRKFNIDDMMNVNGTLISLRDAREVISNSPAADVAPVQPGFWDYVDSSYWRWTPSGGVSVSCLPYRCSRCGRGAAIKSNYCPNCGAKMDGAE